MIKYYRVGMLLWNGEKGTSRAFQDFLSALEANKVPVETAQRGDRMVYGASVGNIVWPPAGYNGNDPNDNVLVFALKSGGAEALFTGDLGKDAEEKFLNGFHDMVDILKVGHHGSKYATSQKLLDTLKPKIAVIEVGKNSYGHPATSTLARIVAEGARVLRTDQIPHWWKIVNDGTALWIQSR